MGESNYSTFQIFFHPYDDQISAEQALWGERFFGQSYENNFPLSDSQKSTLQDPQHETTITNPCIGEIELQQPSNQPQTERKDRKDAHAFSQNVSSKTKSTVCKLLAGNNPKEFKYKIRTQYEEYLKKNKVQNNQMILIFAYLFLKKSDAQEIIYEQFSKDFMKHFEKKLQSNEIKGEKQKQALRVKIKSNLDILTYLFALKGQGEIDWSIIKNYSQPLFQGRQKKRINNPLGIGMKIQKTLLLSIRQIDRQTSNQALNYNQCQ